MVQKAFEHVLKDQRDRLVGELNGRVVDCVKDNNGNHVIQVSSAVLMLLLGEILMKSDWLPWTDVQTLSRNLSLPMSPSSPPILMVVESYKRLLNVLLWTKLGIFSRRCTITSSDSLMIHLAVSPGLCFSEVRFGWWKITWYRVLSLLPPPKIDLESSQPSKVISKTVCSPIPSMSWPLMVSGSTQVCF